MTTQSGKLSDKAIALVSDAKLRALIDEHDRAFDAWKDAKLRDDQMWKDWRALQERIAAMQDLLMGGERNAGMLDDLAIALRQFRKFNDWVNTDRSCAKANEAMHDAHRAVFDHISDTYMRREEFAKAAGLR